MNISVNVHLAPEQSIRVDHGDSYLAIRVGAPGEYSGVMIFVTPEDYGRIAAQLRAAADVLDGAASKEEAA